MTVTRDYDTAVVNPQVVIKGKEPIILNYTYNYNNRGLMSARSDDAVNQEENYEYDNLDRLTKIIYPQCLDYLRTYAYANNGNITQKSEIGNYLYSSSKPNAVRQITPINNGVISPNQCAVTYNHFNQPAQITEGDYRLELFYGADQQRNKMVTRRLSDSSIVNTHYYVNKYYEMEIDATEGTTLYHYVYGDNGAVALHTASYPMPFSKGDTAVPVGLVENMYYIHTDHLGSYCALTDAKRKVVQRNCFDPWGNFVGLRCNDDPPLDKGTPLTDLSFPITARGFTGHEHYPYFKIINMNGRLYDPVISRFFSPDQYVQLPEFTQSFNRYSYCLNNPLKYTDPTGQELVIAGNKANWSFRQLQKFSNLTLSRDKETGIVSATLKNDKRLYQRNPYTGERQLRNEVDRRLMEVINNRQITVKITATNDDRSVRNEAGGAFWGNKFTSFDEYGNGLTIETDQKVNPYRNFILDSFGDLGEGQSLFHELDESYNSALISMRECKEAEPAIKKDGESVSSNPIYREAHSVAAEQPPYNKYEFNHRMRIFEEGMKRLKGMVDMKGISVFGFNLGN